MAMTRLVLNALWHFDTMMSALYHEDLGLYDEHVICAKEIGLPMIMGGVCCIMI
jgi:hypothetical protein